MNQKTSKVEKEFYLRCSYLTLSVLFDKEPKKNRRVWIGWSFSRSKLFGSFYEINFFNPRIEAGMVSPFANVTSLVFLLIDRTFCVLIT